MEVTMQLLVEYYTMCITRQELAFYMRITKKYPALSVQDYVPRYLHLNNDITVQW